MANWIGGSFAPPITKEQLQKYRQLAAKTEPHIREVMEKLCDMVQQWWLTETKAIGGGGNPHPSGKGTVQDLSDNQVKELYDLVPWPYECDAYAIQFDTLSPTAQKEERNAAFHLLWYAKELTQDRHPMTTDKL